MKKLSILFMALLALSLGFTGCSDDEEAFKLVSLTANGIDLNGATAAADVPANTAIVAQFNKDVDATSFAAAMQQDYDASAITLNVVVAGTQVTITPAGQGSGALYIVNFTGIKAAGGEALADFSRSYTTGGSFVPSGMFAYWPFDGDANDALGTYNPSATGVVAITYGADRKGGANGAAVFDGDASIIEIPNGD